MSVLEPVALVDDQMFPSDLEEGIGLGHLMGEGAPVTAPGEERSGPSQRTEALFTEALFTEALFTEALFHRGTLRRQSQGRSQRRWRTTVSYVVSTQWKRYLYSRFFPSGLLGSTGSILGVASFQSHCRSTRRLSAEPWYTTV